MDGQRAPGPSGISRSPPLRLPQPKASFPAAAALGGGATAAGPTYEGGSDFKVCGAGREEGHHWSSAALSFDTSRTAGLQKTEMHTDTIADTEVPC